MDMFLVTAPGLENTLADECRDLGLDVTATSPGGVSVTGNWNDVQFANRTVRGATRVLVRLAAFRAMHLAQLDKRSRKLPWAEWLRADVPVRVEATCRKSRIYHHKAAAERVAKAVHETLGAPGTDDAPVVLKVRIDDDLCTISVDTSGESLHKRGLKTEVNKAPMRETMAASFLRACGYRPGEPVFDPMCGSGTFPIEAAEIAQGLAPGRARRFAFEHLAGFDPDASVNWPDPIAAEPVFFGADRDQGAVRISAANAERAGVQDITQFSHASVSDAHPPCQRPGLVIVNPPYGGRIGNKKPLFGLYGAFGACMLDRFSGWRVGLITSDGGLAKATGLPWQEPGPIVDHGGTKIRLWQTAPLA